MKELERLKKDWKTNNNFPELSKEEIYTFLYKKSSSIVKWIFIISLLEFGFWSLIGLITKNGILVVEFANQLRKEGMNAEKAIFESSLIRLRPVLMTTFSTMLGAIPLVISSGAGAESRYAMAIVVLGGIGLSSLITLYLVPALYRLIETK